MTSKHLGWLLSGSLLLSLAGCDVSIGNCDDDAGDCDIRFDEDEDIDSGKPDGGDPEGDGSVEGDAGLDAGDDTDAGGDGDGDGDGPVYDGEPLELEEFCDAAFSRYLDWAGLIESCWCSQDDEGDLKDGLGVFGGEAGAEGCVNNLKPLITNGSAEYEPKAAGACADAFLKAFAAPPDECPAEGFASLYFRQEVGHGAPALAQISACRATVKGTKGANELCTNDFECGGELRCIGPSGETRRCGPALVRTVTDPLCNRDSECAFGTVCVKAANTGTAKVCRTPATSGGNCARDLECEAGLMCEDNICVTLQSDMLCPAAG